MSYKKHKSHKDSKRNDKKFDNRWKFEKQEKTHKNEKSYKQKLDKWPLLSWIYREWRGEFWFVDTIDKNWNKQWYYVFFTNRWDALPEDEVLFSVKEFKWRKEAVVEKVTKRADKVLTGTFQKCWNFCPSDKKGYGFVVLDNPYFKKDVFIAWKDLKWLEEGDKVALKITKWSGKNPEWKIVDTIGKTGEKYVDVMAMAYEWWARPKFPPKLIETLKNMPHKVEEKDFWKNRKDLRKLFTFTIDPDTAKDFDDAISIEKMDNWNYKLWVHIADVTHYVTEWSELDKEAKMRGTSIYFVDRVVPMLPEILSNELCSLNPFEDKVTMTCEMEINPKGEVVSSEVYESVIKSDFRMSYRIVEDIKNMWFKDWSLDNLIVKNDRYTKKDADVLFEKLRLSYELKEILYKFKKDAWYIEFDLIETSIVVDEKWYPVDIKEYPKYEANKVIEFFMILANEAVAKKFSDLPFLYRIHPEPEIEDIDRLKYALKYVWVEYRDRLTDVIEKIKWRPEENFISKLILKTMTRAVYSPINEWHYGLGLEYYSHFTSPIRRYPDLQIHRIIKEKLNWMMTKWRIEHYKNILQDVANLCSEQEQMAEDIEHKVDKYLEARYMADKIWQEFDGMISWVIERWFFVQLDNTIEWFVDMSSWTHKNINRKSWKVHKEKLDFDNMLLEIRNQHTWERFRLWDKVRIKVKEVDEVFSRIDFELVK